MTQPLVETSYGKLRGREERGICIFRGIPYARPPLGALRYRPPERPQPWAGVREAREFGRAAPQDPNALGPILRLGIGGTSEDCLTLNIWTPATGAGRRPVLVWVHGGAFILGAGSQSLYDGATLARRGDVVVVTINYRLGALGFLRLGDRPGASPIATGNEGLLDQIAALEWVRSEIAAFGGDAGNVTLFGESAGAMSCATLLGTSRAQGLFHRAILQSGSANYVSSREAAARVAEAYLRELDLGADEAAALLDEPPDRIIGAQRRFFLGLLLEPKRVFSGKFLEPRRIGVTMFLASVMLWRVLRRLIRFILGSLLDLARQRPKRRRARFRSLFASLFTQPRGLELPFQPVLDGALLQQHPFDAIGDGLAADVPVLVGTNRDESRLFMLMDPEASFLDEAMLLARCKARFYNRDDGGGSLARRALDTYRQARAARGESTAPRDLWYAMESDRSMRHPAMHLAMLQSAQQAQTYTYLFNWPSPLMGGILGSCHALELPFVFGTLDHPLLRGFAGSHLCGARELAARIQDAWLNFARRGNPAHSGLGPWPAYDATRRATMILDRECGVEDAPREPERAFWDVC